MVSSPLPWRSYRLKLAPLPSSLNGFPCGKIKNYDSGGECFKEFLKVESISWVSDFLEDSEDDLVVVVKPKGAGSHENVLDIDSSLPGIGVEWEKGVDFGDGIGSEDGVFSGDILGEDGLKVFGLDFLFGHEEISFWK